MKKSGFTLAEVLITLGVIGIISALALPAINKLMPDENKINCMKAYDMVSALVKDLASNTKIYPVCKNPEQDDNQNCSEYPLFNTNQPQLLAAFNDVKYSGDKKLCNLLASFMNVKDASCEANVYSFSAANFDTQFNDNKSFTTANGMQWYVVPAVASAYANGIGTFQTDVYVDVNGDKAPNCIYNADSCEKPDRFKFMVAADGSVQAADPVSRGYINSRKIFNKKQLNIAEGNLVDVDKKNFEISKCIVATNHDGKPDEEGDYVNCGATYKGYKVNCYAVPAVDDVYYNWRDTAFNPEIAETIGNNLSYTIFLYFIEPVTSEARVEWGIQGFNDYSYEVRNYKGKILYEHTTKDITLSKVGCKVNVGEQMCTATTKMPTSIYQDVISASQIPDATYFRARIGFSQGVQNIPEIDRENKMVYIHNDRVLKTFSKRVSISADSFYGYGAEYEIVDLERNSTGVSKSDLDKLIN